MKKRVAAFGLALVLAFSAAGCSAKDLLLYLYGGDSFTEQKKEPDYVPYTGTNGVSLVYDANLWQAPMMAQADTLSITAGGSRDYTAVLLQVTDTYTDFLAQSGQELEGETGTVKYDYAFTVPNAAVDAVRYDCGSYQMIFAVLTYDAGGVVYLTAATKLGDETLITDLLQTVTPPGATPETAAGAQ